MVGVNVQFSGYLSRLFLINIDLGCSTRVEYEKIKIWNGLNMGPLKHWH